jgi:Tfp pilus assembly protein PilN
MKIQLNLIRGRVSSFRAKSLRRIFFAVLLGVFLLLIVWMGYIYIGNYYDIKDTQNRVTLIVKQYDTLNPEVFRIVKYKNEWDSLHQKISLTSELKGKQIWWTPRLQAFSELIPENIWISSISVQKSGPGMTLSLQGFAVPGDNRGFRSIENFARQIKENPAFSKIMKDINLTTASRTEKEKISAMSFRLSCQLAAEESL